MDYSRILHNDPSICSELGKMRRVIAGTMSIKRHTSLENAAWIFRTAVSPEYNFAKVMEMLAEDVIQYCKDQKYYSIETVTPECHDDAREMFLRKG